MSLFGFVSLCLPQYLGPPMFGHCMKMRGREGCYSLLSVTVLDIVGALCVCSVMSDSLQPHRP